LAPEELLVAVDPRQWILLVVVREEVELVDAWRQDGEGAWWCPCVRVRWRHIHLGGLLLVEVVEELVLQVIDNLRDC
jgi:hypothetical protein